MSVKISPFRSADDEAPHYPEWPSELTGDRGDHGLVAPTYAMTEQPRTITRRRVVDVSGRVDRATMREIDGWLKDFLSLS